ncbi:hypothetical protein OG216_14230 [Streptomycetaceae bacterium NBC_01309]
MAVPLVVAAVVCLAATSWAWTFGGGDAKSSTTPSVSVVTGAPAAGPDTSISGASGPSVRLSADPAALGPGAVSRPNGAAPNPAPGGAGAPAAPQATASSMPPPAAGA